MNRKFKTFLSSILGLLILAFLFNCTNDLRDQPTGNDKKELALSAAIAGSADFSNLIAYKNSPHQLMMGYYRTWGDNATDTRYKTKMTDLPDSLDIVSVFTDWTPSDSPYWKTLKDTYIPYLHARGTKVIVTGGYFEGASTNPEGLKQWVDEKIKNINEYNYDGYDIDIEKTSYGTELQDQIATFKALSAYLGPKSGTGKLLIYDTNQNGNELVNNIKDMINYVFLQAYWRTASSLTNTYNTYAPYIPTNKFLVGVSFEDETGYREDQMPAYSKWQPTQGIKGGVFAYGIDMEGPNSGRNYITTRRAIQQMNPSGGNIVSGSTYQLVSAVNNTSVLDVGGAGTVNGTKTLLWTNGGGDNQKWIITSVGNGYYKLSPKHAPYMALDVAGGSSSDGTQIQIYTANGTNAQKWKITNAGNGYYTLSPANAASSNLDVNGGSSLNGTKIQIWTANTANAQKWKLVKL
ncbi:TPA: EndoS/ChiA family endoglycosidase [Elizabethkingia anophelis]